MTTEKQTRVAILGGGCGAMAAAFALTATPELRRRYAVTVYQRGFRLGGKGASGRNLERHGRIEEHGMHMWMGWYQNAFRLLRDCYAERRPTPQNPLQQFSDAFTPQRRVTLPEPDGNGGWRHWNVDFPLLPGAPGDEGPALSVSRLVPQFLAWLRSAATSAGLRQAPVLLDLGAAIVRGLVLDVLPPLGRGFESIDDVELRDWLVRHGARRENTWAQPIRAMYTIAFSFLGGAACDPERARIAAGVGLRTCLLMALANRGAPLWRMNGGMGDVVFAPLHEVLAQRGVRFEFFHQVEALRLASDRRAIDSIEVIRQARAKNGSYAPLVEVRGMPCWPSRPLFAQLAHGEVLEASGVDLEFGDVPALSEKRVLRSGEDFDALVLGISLGALPKIGAELVAESSRWQRMVEGIPTVATQAAQLWFAKSFGGRASGWEPTVASAHAPPFDSWGDMSHLLDSENWPRKDAPKSIAYLCACLEDMSSGAAETSPLSPSASTERIERQVRTWLDQQAATTWPGLRTPEGKFDFDQITDHYFRANVDPSDRYVLTPPGTPSLRLHPGDSGFENLFLAGDWTWTPLSCSCVEAAVQSGLLAAQAISGAPRKLLSNF